MIDMAIDYLYVYTNYNVEKQNNVDDCMKGEESVPGERGRDWDDVCNS